MPAYLGQLDVLAVPSRTLPNWKEQFGRVLIEAMACEVAVVGSDSGEIPNVIGSAGLVFPEDDEAALRHHLLTLQKDEEMTRQLGRTGRQRGRDLVARRLRDSPADAAVSCQRAVRRRHLPRRRDSRRNRPPHVRRLRSGQGRGHGVSENRRALHLRRADL